MQTVTLADLKTRARQKADMEDDGNFVSDSELTNYLNESISEFYDLILKSEQGEIFVVPSPVITYLGGYTYQLRDDVYKISSVDVYSGGNYCPAYPHDPRKYAQLAAWGTTARTDGVYYYCPRIDAATGDSYLYIFPSPDVNDLAITYIPPAPQLSLDIDTITTYNRWDEYVTVDAAIKMLDKQEQDATHLLGRKEALRQRISTQASYMDTGFPDTIRNIGRHDRNRILGK